MPDKCVVPGCTSNYRAAIRNEGYVQVFGFPKDDIRRSEWIRAIPRTGWTPSKRSYVCVKHFSETDLSWIEKFKGKDGVWCEYKRDKPVLSPCAIPKLFPNLPTFVNLLAKRKYPEKRRRDQDKRQKKSEEKAVKQLEEEEEIVNFISSSESLNITTKVINYQEMEQLEDIKFETEDVQEELTMAHDSFEEVEFVSVKCESEYDGNKSMDLKDKIVIKEEPLYSGPDEEVEDIESSSFHEDTSQITFQKPLQMNERRRFMVIKLGEEKEETILGLKTLYLSDMVQSLGSLKAARKI